jgi:hypothetical protein
VLDFPNDILKQKFENNDVEASPCFKPFGTGNISDKSNKESFTHPHTMMHTYLSVRLHFNILREVDFKFMMIFSHPVVAIEILRAEISGL